MIVPSQPVELAESLRQLELLTRSQIEQLGQLLANLSDDPGELACALVNRGWLTSYQTEQVLAGKAKNLVLGDYQLLKPLGTGGMGQVFQAKQKRLNRIVALKLIRADLVESNPAAVRRFQHEALI